MRSLRTRCLHLRRRRVQSEAGRAPAKGPRAFRGMPGSGFEPRRGPEKHPLPPPCAGGAFNPRPAGLLRKALGPFVGCREAGSSPVGVQRSTRCLHPAPEARSIRGRQGSCERPSGLSWDAGKRVRAPSGSREGPAASARRIRPEPAAAAAASGTSWRSRTGR